MDSDSNFSSNCSSCFSQFKNGKKDTKGDKDRDSVAVDGDGAKYGEVAQKVIDSALEEINGEGGVKGRKIKVIYEDSQGLPKSAVSAI